MDTELRKVQNILLDKINLVCNKVGLNNIMAQLYAILYLNSKPLSLDDMVEQLEISKGSVSINIRALERYGVVRRIWVRGSRRDYYEAEGDITKVVIDRIKSMAHGRLKDMGDMIHAAGQALDSVESSDSSEEESIMLYRQRFANLKNLYDKAYSFFKLVDSGLLEQLFSSQ